MVVVALWHTTRVGQRLINNLVALFVRGNGSSRHQSSVSWRGFLFGGFSGEVGQLHSAHAA